jgi:carotenoid cleavage dioxygenase-like enzyme
MRVTRRRFIGQAAGAAAALTLPPSEVFASALPADHTLGFASVERELTLPSLKVEGKLPSWLAGTLVRNGPGMYEIGERTFEHWFDGLAMLHAFTFRGGRVSYANRFLRSSAYEAWRTTGQISFSAFATDPCRAIFNGAQAAFAVAPKPNANVNVEALGRAFVAHTEIPLPVKFDPVTLATLGPDGPAPPVGQLGTAHPHRTRSGGRLAYEVQLIPPSAYVLKRGSKELARVPVAKPAYMHSFALTSRYAVLTEAPFVVEPVKLVTDWEPFIRNYRWTSGEPTRFHVIDLSTGRLRATLETDPFFVFHHVNAFDDGAGRLVVDLLAYRDASVIDQLYIKKLRARENPEAPRLTRFSLDLGRKRVESDVITEVRMELPRVAYGRANARSYRYAYGVGLRGSSSGFLDQLVKVDVRSGSVRTWRSRGCFPGEAVFVPAPGGTREDDGVALSVVLDARRKTSFLLVLDPRTYEEIARAPVPQHVPFGFHGAVFPVP